MGTIAEKLDYLNTTKENIKDAIIDKGVSVSDSDTFRSYADKIADIPSTLGTKTITANGTYTATDDSLDGYSSVTVDVDGYAYTDDTTAESVKTITTSALPLTKCVVGIEAQQDLNGYDKPWAGGAGKNILPLMLDTIQSLNTSGTWSGNVYTLNDVTFTVETNDTGAITGITVDGTASGTSVLILPTMTLSANVGYILNGCPSGGSISKYLLSFQGVGYDSGSGYSYTPTADRSVISLITIYSGYVASGLTFYPMIRLSTETDSTFEPYENICTYNALKYPTSSISPELAHILVVPSFGVI